jgi:hypothetical protein
MINVSKPLRSFNQVGLAELILTGGWYIWWERKKYVHGETVQNPTRAAMSIATLTTNYQRAMKKKIRKPEGWKKPSEGKLLLNVDASYKSDRGTSSTGAIIRDSSGSFIAAGSCFMEHVVDASMAEVIALKEGLLMAQHIGCSQLMIQSDFLEAVETMRQDGFSATASAPVYDECNQL